MSFTLSLEEKQRYQRQLWLKDFSEEDQLTLKAAIVTVVGAGGLGAPIIAYLAASGIGELRIIDNDIVSLSNLQRQVLYGGEDLGSSKALRAAERASSINSTIRAIPYPERLMADNSEGIIRGSNLLIDACDNRKTRFLLDDVSRKLQIPFLYGAVEEYSGQIALFHTFSRIGYSDIFPPLEEETEKRGVAILGSVAGTVGSMMATEAIKYLLGRESPLRQGLLLYDALTPSISIFRFPETHS